jgi:hypothetical protein
MKCNMKYLWLVRTVRGSEYRIVCGADVLNAETLKTLEAVVLSFDHTEEGKIASADCLGWCLCQWEKERPID